MVVVCYCFGRIGIKYSGGCPKGDTKGIGLKNGFRNGHYIPGN